jgi:hypothetical protein
MMKLNKQTVLPVVLLVVFAIIAGGAYYLKAHPLNFTKNLKPTEAAQKAVDYANKNLLQGGSKASFESAVEQDGVYAFKLKVDGQEYTSYVTKDGKMMFVSGIPLTDAKTAGAATAATTPTVSKTDKPDVKVFVMSYCPYGLQAEKMYLPVYNLLKNKATLGIYFVNYSMHGKMEVDENLRQYCIQKDQTDKYAAYLQCFVNGAAPTAAGTAADYATCLAKSGINQAKLNSCVASADKQFNVTKDYNDKSTWISGSYPKVEINNDLNEKYGVQGSPTIVINDKEVNVSSRSPEAFLTTVCAAFNNPPAECKTTLSSDEPSTGFGSGTASAGAASGGGCATPAATPAK